MRVEGSEKGTRRASAFTTGGESRDEVFGPTAGRETPLHFAQPEVIVRLADCLLRA